MALHTTKPTGTINVSCVQTEFKVVIYLNKFIFVFMLDNNIILK